MLHAPPTDADAVWEALADPTRRGILDLLARGPHTTGELVAAFPESSRTNVMKHVEVLVAAHLVLPRRAGRVRWNSLNPVPIQRICERWVSRTVQHLASAMLRLKSHTEDGAAARCPARHSGRLGGPA